ncbi:MAG TPA: Crp/Fnr family transcriptional regulator [Candidatus Limiplasma sp.]|nr:Crp/Fnr family transcriptional regulator [Candidatus Limiplasma sp.]
MQNPDMKFVQSALPFWDRLTAAQAELIVSHTRAVSYQQGETVHSGIHDCVGVLILRSGGLRTYILSDEGKEVTLFRLADGEACVLSASCLIRSITFDIFIEAVRPTEIYLVEAQAFAKVMEENIYVENFALRLTAERFSEVMWAMEQILFMSFDRRLAIFLLDETAKSGVDNITMTHEQIARYVGSAREVVSRMLKYFAREGMVAVHRGGVEITDKQKLRKLL